MKLIRVVGIYQCAAIAAFLFGVSSVSAQYFPTFGSAVTNSTGSTSAPEGVAIAAVPGTTVASEVLAAVNLSGQIYTYISSDGSTYQPAIRLPFTNQVYCSAVSHTDACTPAIVNFNGTPYISYRDTSNNLNIFQGTLDSGDDYYTWTSVAVISPGYGGMSTSPQMVSAFGKIMIIYGVSSINGVTNALVTTSSPDGINWSTTDSGLGALTVAAPTQVGLSMLGSTLYMVSQQNN